MLCRGSPNFFGRWTGSKYAEFLTNSASRSAVRDYAFYLSACTTRKLMLEPPWLSLYLYQADGRHGLCRNNFVFVDTLVPMLR